MFSFFWPCDPGSFRQPPPVTTPAGSTVSQKSILELRPFQFRRQPRQWTCTTAPFIPFNIRPASNAPHSLETFPGCISWSFCVCRAAPGSVNSSIWLQPVASLCICSLLRVCKIKFCSVELTTLPLLKSLDCAQKINSSLKGVAPSELRRKSRICDYV